ncbi:MAG: hypothetical protein IJO81_01450 [Clostridia bacterium]|nr:hypothetical protein [Clostridia bacterium]
MELIKISPTKLKIMLSQADVKKYDLAVSDGKAISGNGALRTILADVKEKCGFDAVGARVFVQYYEGIDGGCEMFITKLAGEGAPRGGGAEENGRSEMNNAQPKKRYAERYDSGYIVYSFSALGDLLATCRCLDVSGYSGDSRAYVIKDKCRYYLVLDRETYFAAENNGVKCTSAYFYVLTEHGRLICTQAVGKLASLA